jgi:hypothetical protein
MNYEPDIDSNEPPPRRIGLEEAIFVVLVILSLIGIRITDFSPHDGYGYWLLMVFVFATLSIFVGWLQSRQDKLDISNMIKSQASHWLHTLIVVGAAFLLNKSDQLSETSASLVILLILALSTMLDGYRIGWQFSLLGFFLAGCAIVVAYIERFMLACVVLGVLVVLGSFFWNYWAYKQTEDSDA